MNTPESIIFPRLETPRLALRRLTQEDAPDVFHLFSDERVAKNMDIDTLTDIEQARQLIRDLDTRYHHDTGIRWGISLKGSRQVIGTAGINHWVHALGSRGEIGYDLLPDFWGQGLMPEALRPILHYGYTDLGLHRIEAMVNPNNERSMRVLIKLGFQREGILRDYGYWRGRFWDQVCFSLLKGEWLASRLSEG